MAEDLKREIQANYRQALQAGTGNVMRSIPEEIYTRRQLQKMPRELLEVSFPCGNPVAAADLKPGEVVLDVACGAGMDCFLAAPVVGGEGRVYGLELTKEMLEQAIKFRRQLKVKNVQFLHGDMEQIPLPDARVDVVMANCGINLVPDKPRVVREIARVLKPNGRLVVADVVTEDELPGELQNDPAAWAWCLGGACKKEEWQALLKKYFSDMELTPQRDYHVELPGGRSVHFQAVLITAKRGE